MKTSQALLGIMGATTAGFILGVLFAPDKGSNTRKKIAQKGKEYSDEFKDKLNTIVSQVSSSGKDLMEEVKNQVSSSGKDLMEEVKSKSNIISSDIKKEAH